MTTVEIGARFSFRKTITVAEQAMFTGISGNLGALYVDVTRAKAQGAPAAVGFELIAGMLATTSLNRLAGPDYRIAQMNLTFPAPVYVGQSVAAEATVTALEGDTLLCSVLCKTVPEGVTVAEGTATMALFAAALMPTKV